MPWSLAAKAVAVLLVLVGATAAGWRQGVKATLADWRAADMAAQSAQTEAQAEHQRLAATASAAYEATRTNALARQQETRHAITHAARAVQACSQQQPHQPPLALADVLVPAAILGRLRDAAGDGEPGGPTAAQPGRAVQPGAGIPGI